MASAAAIAWSACAVGFVGVSLVCRQRARHAAAAAKQQQVQHEQHEQAVTECLQRHVVCADAVQWLDGVAGHTASCYSADGAARTPPPPPPAELDIPPTFDLAGFSAIISMPDFSEMPLSNVRRVAPAAAATMDSTALALARARAGAEQLARYKLWFHDAAAAALRALHPNQFAIFYQSDVRVDGEARAGRSGARSRTAEWRDKAFLVQLAALRCQGGALGGSGERANARCGFRLLSHRIYCTQTGAGKAQVASSRPAYTHQLCFVKFLCTCGARHAPEQEVYDNTAATATAPAAAAEATTTTATAAPLPPKGDEEGGAADAAARHAQLARGCCSDGGLGCVCGPTYDPFAPGLPDVVSKGPSLWVRGMDLRAVHDAVRFLAAQPGVEGVLDPFCGVGTALAAANAYGLPALGVDNSPPRCRKARVTVLTKAAMREEKGTKKVKTKGKCWSKGHDERLPPPLPRHSTSNAPTSGTQEQERRGGQQR